MQGIRRAAQNGFFINLRPGDVLAAEDSVDDAIDFAQYGIDAPDEGHRIPHEGDPHVSVPRFARALPECLSTREFLDQVEALHPYSFPRVRRAGIDRYIAIRQLARAFLRFKNEEYGMIEQTED